MENLPKAQTLSNEQATEGPVYKTLEDVKNSIFTSENGGAVIVDGVLSYIATNTNAVERFEMLEKDGFTVEVSTRKADEGGHDVYDVKITKN